ncbi:MAG TPA: bifunctional precorrin-2 dehydrogenase/sirohydrochlorin ferrochelatase [Acidimicrobiales bacterium]|nr:bifunctional precorrin-2 dehydrogenase/sirohydrochlorin ferrochelatase [Acidimicrobiales bacterium]
MTTADPDPPAPPTPAGGAVRRYYPVVLDVAGRPCLVVGGGRVGARKVRGLVDCGASVTVVAPDVVPAIAALAEAAPGLDPPAAVTVRRRPYRAGEAARYRLVVTATGVAAVDRAVVADAQAAGVWVNTADDPRHGTFFLPSVHRDGPVTVSVSTGGSSPALAAWLRRRLAAAVGPEVGVLAGLLDEARRRVAAEGRPTEAVDWQAILDGPLPDLVAAGHLDEAKALLAAATAPVD